MTRPITRAEAEVFELFHESVFVRDMQGQIHFWNSASETLYEWSSQLAVGSNARALLQCEGTGRPEAADAKLLSDGHWRGELCRTTASGERRDVNVRWSLRRDASGVPVGIIETSHDISAAKEIERRLVDSEYRYRNLFQAMAASFWELDFTKVGAKLRVLLESGVEDLETYFQDHPEVVREYLRDTQVIDLNDHSVRLFGRGNREEMLGSVDPYWPDASIQVYARCIVKSLARHPNNIEVTRLQTLDGRELECLFTACFSKENMARGIILIGIIDLSEQVAARQALEVMQTELAHAARITILGELTASITHEINQPLGAISAYAEAGLRWLTRPEPDLKEVELALRSIVSEAKRTDDVIARVRSMAVRRAPAECIIPINEVIRESLQFTRQELQKHRVKVELDLASSLPDISADRVLIQQVIVNLVMNAVQAMALKENAGRELLIQSTNLLDGKIAVNIVDSGPGISEDHLERLFESFFTTKSTGMGMGLPICRSIIEAAGGEINLANRCDGQQGANIMLTLPEATAGGLMSEA